MAAIAAVRFGLRVLGGTKTGRKVLGLGAGKGKRERIFGSGFDVKHTKMTPGAKNKKQNLLAAGGGGGTGCIIDDTIFRKYLEELRNKFTPPKTFWSVLESETLQVLQKSAQRTKRANMRKLNARYNPNSKYFNHMVRLNGKLYSLKNRYSNALWSKLMARHDYYKERAFDRLGLSKAIFYKIAKDDLRIKGYSRGWQDYSMIKRSYRAQSSVGKKKARKGGKPFKSSWYKSGWGKRVKKNNRSIDLTWGLDGTLDTLNPYAKGAGAVHASVKARVTHFRRACKNGYFKDADWVASRFPGIKVGK